MPNPPRDEQCQVGKCKREYGFTYYGKRICPYCWEKYAEKREKLFDLLKIPKSQLVTRTIESPITPPSKPPEEEPQECNIEIPDLLAELD